MEATIIFQNLPFLVLRFDRPKIKNQKYFVQNSIFSHSRDINF